MNSRSKALVIGAVLALSGILPASAQLVVFDPVNFSQNILTAARELMQVENQLQQLQNEAQMLINEAKNLEGSNLNTLTRLKSTLALAQQWLNQANGLSLTVTQLQADYARLYPTTYPAGVTFNQLDADSQQRWSYSHDALATALVMQAQSSQNFTSDISVLSDTVAQSQSAIGALQVAQVTNQLLALQARQTIQSQQLKIAEDRSAAIERARSVEAVERARVLRVQFMTQTTTYTAQPVQALP
jgi:type IV secretion system protein TrbJ